MRRALSGLAEFVFITGLLAVAVLALPYIAWKWLRMPREVDGTGWFMPDANPKRSSGGVGRA